MTERTHPAFTGYKYEGGKSSYRGEISGEGGYVFATPGIYHNIALLDVASMHPTSIEQLNLFGDEYTERYSNIKKARVAIKHGEWDKADKLLDGKLKPVIDDLKSQGVEIDEKQMAFALKIPINSVYGMTSARFDNKFKDPRNIDNIVAKRGSLFMIDLKHFVQEQGFVVAHIKTDSIKIPDATPEIIEKVMEFGRQYGYEFEHEATYDSMCLVNDAVYIAKDKYGWHATGAQFQHPIVFKTLFSKEDISVEDYYETKSVTTALYLDFKEEVHEGEHNYKFIGKAGRFVPVIPGAGGGVLLRKNTEVIDDSRFDNGTAEKKGIDRRYFSAAAGTKGFLWMEAEMNRSLGLEGSIDKSYSAKLVDAAVEKINQFGSLADLGA